MREPSAGTRSSDRSGAKHRESGAERGGCRGREPASPPDRYRVWVNGDHAVWGGAHEGSNPSARTLPLLVDPSAGITNPGCGRSIRPRGAVPSPREGTRDVDVITPAGGFPAPRLRTLVADVRFVPGVPIGCVRALDLDVKPPVERNSTRVSEACRGGSTPPRETSTRRRLGSLICPTRRSERVRFPRRVPGGAQQTFCVKPDLSTSQDVVNARVLGIGRQRRLRSGGPKGREGSTPSSSTGQAEVQPRTACERGGKGRR